MATSFSNLSISDLFHLDDDIRRLRPLILSHWVVIAVSITYIFIYMFIGAPFLALSNGFMTGSMFLALWALRLTKHYTAVTHFSIGAASIHLMNCAIGSGNSDSPMLVWMILIPLAAVFFTTPKGFLFWSLMTFMSFMLVWYIDRVGWIHPYPLTIAPEHKYFLHMASFISVVFIAAGWFYFFGQAVIKSFEEVVKSKEQISNLVRILGHDIAGPTTVLGNYADMLEDGGLPEAQVKKIAQIFKRNTDAINTLISKIRELNALESGKKELALISFSVDLSVEKAVALVRERFDQKRVELKYQKKGESFNAFGEPDILALQIVPNLLTNALKFSKEGTAVSVEVSSAENNIEVSISDQGVGIPANILPNLFSYNKKTTRVGTSGEKGTGFGMPLVKSFVEKMQGTIEVQSRAEEEDPIMHGTKVVLKFPRKTKNTAAVVH